VSRSRSRRLDGNTNGGAISPSGGRRRAEEREAEGFGFGLGNGEWEGKGGEYFEIESGSREIS